MKILLSNDDGVNAKGLTTLAQVLSEIADIVIVAPDRNRSGASNSLTLDSPLHVETVRPNVYSVQGTPTDCVHFALNELLKGTPPDFLVSGINHGANLGDDVLYSGTVAAAMEGYFLGVPSIAVSLVGKTHFDTAAHIAKEILLQHSQYPMPYHQLLNVNVPDLAIEQLAGSRVVRLGSRHHVEEMIKQQDPRGKDIYWLGPPGQENDAGEGTDFYAINKGEVAITPLNVDLTAHDKLQAIQDWLK